MGKKIQHKYFGKATGNAHLEADGSKEQSKGNAKQMGDKGERRDAIFCRSSVPRTTVSTEAASFSDRRALAILPLL
ncbi:hypothetical protein [Rhodococcus sp. ARC_M6]|uniref:hypothetical protein n=1 Tax=Rhodococcus sp. ARC_M6 TaxID=2928852 RepID=UPI0035B16C0E